MNKAKFALLKFSILFYLILFFPNNSYSQSDSTRIKKWSVGVYGGYIMPVSNFATHYTLSPTLGFELSYNFNSFLSLYINGTFDFLNTIDFVELYFGSYHYSASCIEATIGGKYNFSRYYPRFFSEVALGYYRMELTPKNNIETINNITNNFGFNAGLGLEFYIYKDIIVVSPKLYYTTIITPIYEYDRTYYGLSIGLKYSF